MDGHCSRQSLDLLPKLIPYGVHLFSWLPHTTSQTQAADVGLFGDWKAKLMSLKAQHRGPKSTWDNVRLGAQALAAVATRGRLLNAVRKTGMRPYTRQPHLDNPVIKLGDVSMTEIALPHRGCELLSYIHRGEVHGQPQLASSSGSGVRGDEAVGGNNVDEAIGAMQESDKTGVTRSERSGSSSSATSLSIFGSISESLETHGIGLGEAAIIKRSASRKKLQEVTLKLKCDLRKIRLATEVVLLQNRSKKEQECKKKKQDADAALESTKAASLLKLEAAKATHAQELEAAKAAHAASVAAADNAVRDYVMQLQRDLDTLEHANQELDKANGDEDICLSRSTVAHVMDLIEKLQHAEPQRSPDRTVPARTSPTHVYNTPPPKAKYSPSPLRRADMAQMSREVNASLGKAPRRLDTTGSLFKTTNTTHQTSFKVIRELEACEAMRYKKTDDNGVRDAVSVFVSRNCVGLPQQTARAFLSIVKKDFQASGDTPLVKECVAIRKLKGDAFKLRFASFVRGLPTATFTSTLAQAASVEPRAFASPPNPPRDDVHETTLVDPQPVQQDVNVRARGKRRRVARSPSPSL